MASRFLLRLGGGVARSARAHRLPAGQVGARSPAAALGGPGTTTTTTFPAVQSRYASDVAKSPRRPTLFELAARIQALEEARALSDKKAELLERRAEVAEKRAEEAETRAELAEKRSDMAEKRVEMLVKYAQRWDSRIDRLDNNFFVMLDRVNKLEEESHINFFVMLHLYWLLSREVAALRERVSAMKADYQNAVLDSKNAVSSTSWRIILTLLGGFGAITIFYLPYVVSGIKSELMVEITNKIKEHLQPVLDEMMKMKSDKQGGRWWWR